MQVRESACVACERRESCWRDGEQRAHVDARRGAHEHVRRISPSRQSSRPSHSQRLHRPKSVLLSRGREPSQRPARAHLGHVARRANRHPLRRGQQVVDALVLHAHLRVLIGPAGGPAARLPRRPHVFWGFRAAIPDANSRDCNARRRFSEPGVRASCGAPTPVSFLLDVLERSSSAAGRAGGPSPPQPPPAPSSAMVQHHHGAYSALPRCGRGPPRPHDAHRRSTHRGQAGTGTAPRTSDEHHGGHHGGLTCSACRLSCSLPEGEPGADMESPMLAGAETYEWSAVPNLDLFLTRLYRCVPTCCWVPAAQPPRSARSGEASLLSSLAGAGRKRSARAQRAV